jgi:hypothetical protein
MPKPQHACNVLQALMAAPVNSASALEKLIAVLQIVNNVFKQNASNALNPSMLTSKTKPNALVIARKVKMAALSVTQMELIVRLVILDTLSKLFRQ